MAIVVRVLLLQKNTAMGRLNPCAGAGVLHEGSDIDSNVEEVPLFGGLQPFNPTCLALSAPASALGAGMPGLGSPWSILSRSLLSDEQLAGSTPQHSEAAAAHISSPAAARGAAADFSSTAAAEAVLQALDCWAWQLSSFESSAAGSSTPGVFQHLILAASRGVRLPCTLPGGPQNADRAQQTPAARAEHALHALSGGACGICVLLLQCIWSHLVTALTKLLRLLWQVLGSTQQTPVLRARAALRTP